MPSPTCLPIHPIVASALVSVLSTVRDECELSAFVQWSYTYRYPWVTDDHRCRNHPALAQRGYSDPICHGDITLARSVPLRGSLGSRAFNALRPGELRVGASAVPNAWRREPPGSAAPCEPDDDRHRGGPSPPGAAHLGRAAAVDARVRPARARRR